MGKRAPHIEGYVSVSEAVGELGSGFNPYSKTREYRDKMVTLGGFIYFEDKVFAEIKKDYKSGFPVKNNRRKFYFLKMSPEEIIKTVQHASEKEMMLMPVEADEAVYGKGRRNGISGLVDDGTVEYEIIDDEKWLPATTVLNLIINGYGQWKNMLFERVKIIVSETVEREMGKLSKRIDKKLVNLLELVESDEIHETVDYVNDLKRFFHKKGVEIGGKKFRGRYEDNILYLGKGSYPYAERVITSIYSSVGKENFSKIEETMRWMAGASPFTNNGIDILEGLASTLIFLDRSEETTLKSKLISIISKYHILGERGYEPYEEFINLSGVEESTDLKSKTNEVRNKIGRLKNKLYTSKEWKDMRSKMEKLKTEKAIV